LAEAEAAEALIHLTMAEEEAAADKLFVVTLTFQLQLQDNQSLLL
jgi:hypothetical protein